MDGCDYRSIQLPYLVVKNPRIRSEKRIRAIERDEINASGVLIMLNSDMVPIHGREKNSTSCAQQIQHLRDLYIFIFYLSNKKKIKIHIIFALSFCIFYPIFFSSFPHPWIKHIPPLNFYFEINH